MFKVEYTWSLPSPAMLPKLGKPLLACDMDGGRPPLADGAGIGVGECAGEVTRGSRAGVNSEAFCGW